MKTYKFVFDNGTIVLIDAKSRKEAISIYCETRGMDKSYLQKHCVVRLLGRQSLLSQREQHING